MSYPKRYNVKQGGDIVDQEELVRRLREFSGGPSPINSIGRLEDGEDVSVFHAFGTTIRVRPYSQTYSFESFGEASSFRALELGLLKELEYEIVEVG